MPEVSHTISQTHKISTHCTVPQDPLPRMRLPPLHQRNRPRIFVPRNKHKMHPSDHQHPYKDNTRPIEIRRRDRRKLRPETPEERPKRVRNGQRIDRDAPFPQAELCVGQGLRVADPAPEEAADREAVALEKGDGQEGGDCVEGDGGTDVDEAEADADHAGDDDGVGGDTALFVDFGDPWIGNVSVWQERLRV